MSPFEKLLADLARADVEFILVGGLAVALAGYVRATEDVDVLIRAERENVKRLLDCLKGFGEGAAAELRTDDFAPEEGAIRVVEDFPLDLFTQMSGHTYEDLLPQTSEHDVAAVRIRSLNIEGLILLKAGSLRPKDQLDVQALKAILREQSGGTAHSKR